MPSGVYTIPEIACVGLSQTEAAAKKIDVIVGRADFGEVARAHIVGEPAGFLTLLCERGSAKVLGVQVLGEGATELVHLGQAAIANGASRRFLHRADFQFPDHDRGVPDCGFRHHEAALAGCTTGAADDSPGAMG